MKKRLLSILIVLCLCLSVLSACASSGETAGFTGSAEPASDRPTAGFSNDVSSIESPEENIEQQDQIGAGTVNEEESGVISSSETAAAVEWTDVSYTTTDTDGYVYEITLKVSPWILLSNTDIVNSAWSEVGKSNTLPGFNSWSLRQDSLGTYFRQGLSNGNSTSYFAFNMSDMYYCVGTAQITNITEGWSIDASSPRSLYFGLQWVSSFDKSAYAGVYAIGRVFYSNETTDGCNGLAHSAKMTSDHWGPVSFVIMAPENFSPNYPDGEHPQHMLDGFFRYYDNGEAKEVHIGVIGKNGLYTPSISVETDG